MTAVISPDGVYRYRLDRSWGLAHRGRVCWVMLNPSTADADDDDPTIRRCIGFTSGFGYDSLTVINLYGARATDPRHLRHIIDPIGPGNSDHFAAALTDADLIVCAWGGNGPARDRAYINDIGLTMRLGGAYHLGLTAAGQPRHPLYLRADTKLQRWVP